VLIAPGVIVVRPLNFVTHTAEFRDTQGRAGDKLNTLRSLQNEGAWSLSKLVRFSSLDHTPA
jgi:hypothetical protein